MATTSGHIVTLSGVGDGTGAIFGTNAIVHVRGVMLIQGATPSRVILREKSATSGPILVDYTPTASTTTSIDLGGGSTTGVKLNNLILDSASAGTNCTVQVILA